MKKVFSIALQIVLIAAAASLIVMNTQEAVELGWTALRVGAVGCMAVVINYSRDIVKLALN